MGTGRLALLAAATVALAACGRGSEPSESQSTPARGAATAAEDTGIKLAAGFAATIFADGLDRPRHIAVRDNGDVFVALRSGRQQIAPQDSEGGIAALRDTNGDGKADLIERFGRGDVDTGLAIHDDTIYFSSAVAVYALPLTAELAPPGSPSS